MTDEPNSSHTDTNQEAARNGVSNQPGTLPPGTPPPATYPPNAGTMPPNYPPPFIGNVPPGALPPGYPTYFMPLEFPPPSAYAVPPPSPGYPWEIVAPTQGNLVQAWFAIATNLSRRSIAARAQAMQPHWATWSIVIGVIFSALAGILNGMRQLAFPNPANLAGGSHNAQSSLISENFIHGEAIATLFVTPLFFFAEIFLLPWFLSFFMTPLLGSSRQRFQRALKLFALIQPLIGTIALIEAILSFAIYRYAPAYDLVVSILVQPFLVYMISLNIQTGAVGAGLKRWPVFGIELLAYLAVTFVVLIMLIVALAVFILTQAR